jgi:ATP-binding cassette subfamily F protein 3
MIPAIRTILGGFLFEGDDVYKKAAVLSGGERTRLAVARMLLRPSNTLLLDEPTNHLDLDSKDVLLDALEDFGGTLVLVSHDRYFIDKLATKVVEIGNGQGLMYPGDYEAFLWSKSHQAEVPAAPPPSKPKPSAVERSRGPTGAAAHVKAPSTGPTAPAAGLANREEKKRLEAEQRRHRRAVDAIAARISTLEATIAQRENEMREIQTAMSAPGFYEDHQASKPVLDRHQTLMWELGDLMHQWEELSAEAEALASRTRETAET